MDASRTRRDEMGKAYECQCHVCGAIHAVKCCFMSASSYIVGRDGKQRPQKSCGKHTREEVRAAYLAR